MAAPLKTPVSPKVSAGANTAGWATILLALLNNVDPNGLAVLGPTFEPIAIGLIVGGAYALRAYLKEDPLRTAGAQPSPALDVADLLAKLQALLPDKTQPAVADAVAVAKSIPAVAAQLETPATEPASAPVEPAAAPAAPVEAPAAPVAPAAPTAPVTPAP